MSMNLCLQATTLGQLHDFNTGKAEVEDVVMAPVFARLNKDNFDLDDIETEFRSQKAEGPLQWLYLQFVKWLMKEEFDRARRLIKTPSPVSGEMLNLHKSWHALHYLFTNTAWDGDLPAAFLLKGGKEMGDDLGYGSARVLSPEDVASFAQFLRSESTASLIERANLHDLRTKEIYSVDEGLIDDIAHYFPRLQAYVNDAEARGDGLIVWMM